MSGTEQAAPQPEETAAASTLGTPQQAGWPLVTSWAPPDAVYVTWLRMQCDLIPGAHAGLLVLQQPGTQSYRTIAAWPPTLMDVASLADVAQQALNERQTILVDDRPVAGAPSVPVRPRVLFGQPIGAAERQLPIGAVVVAVDERLARLPDQPVIARQLHWGGGWIEAMEWRRLSEDNAAATARVTEALDLVAIGGEHRRLNGSALAIANELAARFGCSRVAIGMFKRDEMHLAALSHSATFDRRSQLVGAIEGAMAEALHQNRMVLEPAPASKDAPVAIAHRELLKKSGAGAAASFVMHGRGGAVGAITLERDGDTPFREAECQLMDAASALLGPVLELQLDQEKWVTGRGTALIAGFRDRLFGPRHPTFKLVASLVAAFLLLSLIIPGAFRVSAKSVVEGQIRRTLVAPFDGYILNAHARAGDVVRAGQVIAQLDDRDATLEQTRWTAERQTLVAKYDDALARHDRSALTILAAQTEQASAQLALAQEKLARTRIVAPFDGVVTSGDLSQVLGSPIERGKVLFELAPLDRYRVIVQVDERDIRYVKLGQEGKVVLAGMPADAMPLVVSKVTPLATADEGRNYFRVEATLKDHDRRLRPGMEGVARIRVGTRPLLWTWSRSMVDWIRITLWKWLP